MNIEEIGQQIIIRLDDLIRVIDNPYVAWATVATAIVAVAGFIWNAIQLRHQRKIGLSLEIIDNTGNGIIKNNSQSDYKVELNKYVLDDGFFKSGASQASDLTISILRSLKAGPEEAKRKILEIKEGKEKERLVLPQVLAPNETVQFHIHNLTAEDVTVAFILLEFKRDRKASYQLYRFAGRSREDFIPQELRGLCQPHLQWVRVFGFDGLC